MNKTLNIKFVLLALAITSAARLSFALDGQVGIHDPSTVVRCEGRYYVFGTGGGGLISDDGWAWHSGAVRPGGGVAPDVIHIGDRYIVAYGGSGGIHTMWTRSLDPNSTNMDFQDDTLIAGADLDMNPIDPSLMFEPGNGKLWLTYGSYVGYIRVLELDPHTAKPVPDAKAVDIAINCEASQMIYRNGWYYLLANHGSCCQGANSGYNIRVGRSRSPTGPFVDDTGLDMLQGGGKLFLGSSGRDIGPGHFGLLDLGDGVQKFSCHYEADLDHGGASVLAIRPLLWQDDWPVAGDNLKEGTYRIESVRAGTALELAVEGVPVGGGRSRGTRRNGVGLAGITNAAGRGAFGGGAGFGGGGRGAGSPIPNQDVAVVSTNWPTGNIDLRMHNYMCQAQEKWAISAVTNAGGYPGSPYFKITISGTDRALAATEEKEITTVPAFTGAPEQLWRIDELVDGSWRIMPKSVPNSADPLALSAIGNGFATLAKFDPDSDRFCWHLNEP